MDMPLNTLIVANSIEDIESLLIELCYGGYEVTFKRVDTAAGMMAALPEEEWDIVIADHNVFNFGPSSGLKVLQKSGTDLPLIVICSSDDEDLAIETMIAGAQDYVLKDNLRRLLPIIQRELRENEFRRKRKLAEEKLRESDQILCQLTENITEVFWISSTDESGMLYISPAYEEIWGRTCKSLYEQPTTWLNAIHPDDRNRIERALITHQVLWIQHGLGIHDEEFRIIRPDGSVRWIRDRAFPIKDATGRVYRVAGIAEDITERKQAEETRLHLSSIVESSEDAIISTTPDGIIQSWNRGAERIFGYLAQEIIGQPISIIIPTDRISEEAVLKRISTGEYIEPYETVRIRKDGRRLDVFVTTSPIKDYRGRIIGASKIARDITHRKESEREREELLAREQRARQQAHEANRLKEEFLAIIFDELRIPLNPTYGWTQLLRMGELEPKKQHAVMEALEQNAKTREHVIKQLLDISHMIAGKLRLELRPLNLIPIVEAAIQTVRRAAEAKQIEMKMMLDPSIDPIMVDSDRLQEVVWSLLSNAIKFTPNHGRIDIFLEQVNPYIQIRVKDNGTGISSDLLPYIFDGFRRDEGRNKRPQRGLGLGLSIVQHLVELHGGDVLAESGGETQGTTFIVRLPIRANQKMKDVSEPVRSLAKGKGKEPLRSLPSLHRLHLLVIDDELDVRTLLTVALEAYGIQVTAAASAQEAMEILERERLDLLISDIRMPIKDGYALLKKIREWEKRQGICKIPVIALTSFAREDEHDQALSAGFQAYIPKQVKPDKLVTVIAELVGQSA